MRSCGDRCVPRSSDPTAPIMTREPAVRVTGIHRTFGHVQALRGVSFDVGEGEFLVLLGPSGSGKTTILRVIAGFEELTEGAVVIRGRPVAEVPPNRREIGVVFQHFALFPHLTVFRNVAFGLEMRRVPRKELRARVIEALDMVRLVGLDDRMPNQLSGGQQQRVALARALVTRPAVLLLDEPLGSLDPHLRAEMQVEIRRLQQTLAISAIMVTHDQVEAMTMADRIAILHEGQLQQIGTPREIYGAPASAFVARFIGAANVFDVVDVSAAQRHAASIDPGWPDVDRHGTRTNSWRQHQRDRAPGTVYLGTIPPISRTSSVARVTSITYMGAVTRCQVVIADNLQVTATVPTPSGIATCRSAKRYHWAGLLRRRYWYESVMPPPPPSCSRRRASRICREQTRTSAKMASPKVLGPCLREGADDACAHCLNSGISVDLLLLMFFLLPLLLSARRVAHRGLPARCSGEPRAATTNYSPMHSIARI